MNTQKNMVVYTTPSSRRFVRTVFGQFLQRVGELCGERTQTMHGAAIWQIPSTVLVLSGLWVVMLKVAKSLGTSLDTQTRVSEVSQYVERLLSVGMLMRHGSGERCAEVFYQHVVGGIDRAVAAGYRPGMTISADNWKHVMHGDTRGIAHDVRGQREKPGVAVTQFVQMPSALFFADYLRLVRETAEHLEAIRVEVVEKNIPDGESAIELVNLSGHRAMERSGAFLALCPLEVVDKNPRVDAARPELFVDASSGKLEEDLLNLLAVQEELKALRPNPDEHGTEAIAEGTLNVIDTWLGTHLMLSVDGDAPPQECFINLSRYAKLCERFKAYDAEVIRKAFWKRMRARVRKVKETPAINALLLDEKIPELKRDLSHVQPQRLHLMVRLDVGAQAEDLLGKGTILLDVLNAPEGLGMSLEDLPDAVRERLLGQLNWEVVSGKELYRLWAEGCLLEELVPYIGGMSEHERVGGIRRILRSKDVSARDIAHMLDKQLIDADPSLFSHNQFVEIPEHSGKWGAVMARMMTWYTGRNFDMNAKVGDQLPHLFTGLARMARDQGFFELAFEHRSTLARALHESVLMGRTDVKRSDEDEVLAMLGSIDMELELGSDNPFGESACLDDVLLLGGIALNHEDMYQSEPDESVTVAYPFHEEVRETFTTTAKQFPRSIDKDHLVSVAEHAGEIAFIEFLAEDMPTAARKKRIAAFKRNRKKYFKALGIKVP